MKERTRSVDKFKAFKNMLNDLKIPIFKLASISTDGAAAIIGRINGFIALCQNEDEFPAFWTPTLLFTPSVSQQETKHKTNKI